MRSWYAYSGGDQAGLHPWQGETTLKYSGPKPPYEQLAVEQKYTWLKAPRWNETPMRSGRWRACWRCTRLATPRRRSWSTPTLKALDAPTEALSPTLA